MTFSVQVTSTSTTPTTASPGGVITINGPNATPNIPGQRQDSSDFYGIFVVIAAIVVVIIAARALFGRKRA